MSVTGSLFFSRFCRRYGRSPHFLDLSCCLYNRLTAGLLMCAIRLDHMKYSRKFVFYNFCLECTRIPGTGIHVLALCVFLLEAFPRSLFCRGAKENKDWWSRHIIAFCVIVWFSMKGDSCSGFFVVISICHRSELFCENILITHVQEHVFTTNNYNV